MELAQSLKYHREANNETQDSIASAMKISRTTYANYEQGKSEPNAQFLVSIARHYGILVDELLEPKGNLISEGKKKRKGNLKGNLMGNVSTNDASSGELERLKQELAGKEDVLASKDKIIASLEQNNSDLRNTISILSEQISLLKREVIELQKQIDSHSGGSSQSGHRKSA